MSLARRTPAAAFSVLALLVLLPASFARTAAPAAASLAVPVGPPLVCHPFDIGEARSLPWRAGGFGTAPDYDLARLPRDTCELLERSDDPFVHMETLRRAVVYVTGLGEGGPRPEPAQRDALIAALLEELQFDADVHQAELVAAREAASAAPHDAAPAPPSGTRYLVQPEPAPGGRTCQAQARDAALCWFDVGYLRAALRQAGAPQKDGGLDALRAALLLRPDDARLRLGLALGLFDDPDAAVRAERWKELDAVVQQVENVAAGHEAQAESLRRNLLASVGPLLGTKDPDELVAAIHERARQG